MTDAWDRGARHMAALTGTRRTSATFEGDINLPISFGNRDAAAFHRFKAFSSAIVKDAEVADALKESLAQALERGESLAEWQRNAADIFDKLGVSRLNSWQAEFIYRNETAMAHGAGEWASLQSSKSRWPYWRYSTRKDHRVRPSHRILEGKIFAAEDKEFYPPIGWLCRCVAIPISRREAEKLSINKPDTVTPEMRAELKNAEFIGDKIKLFEDWLNEKMATLDPDRKALIKSAVADIQLGISEIRTAYSSSTSYTEIAYDDVTGAFIATHKKADKVDLKPNLDAAQRLYENGWSVVINEHFTVENTKNPEYTIIDAQGRKWVSDLKTPETTISKGIKNAVERAIEQDLSHVVIDVGPDAPLEKVAEGIARSYGRYPAMQRIIILCGRQAVEISRSDYAKGKTLEILQDGLK
ncbi:MAG: minor capsid protein [Chlorobiaceae bacterium]|nr:minor capsid protein [Chlorobiaceae bacterium]